MKSIEITDENLKEILSSDGITVLDFWAEWCGPCRMVGPIIDDLAKNNDDVVVGKLNVDKNGTTAASYGIRSIPTIMFFRGGEKVGQVNGVVPLVKLQNIVDELKKS